MAKRTFEVGQTVYVYNYKSADGTTLWNKGTVVGTVNKPVWGGFSSRSGSTREYIKVELTQSWGRGNGTYVKDVMNARNRIVSEADYASIEAANQAIREARAARKQEAEDSKMARARELVQRIRSMSDDEEAAKLLFDTCSFYGWGR